MRSSRSTKPLLFRCDSEQQTNPSFF